MVEHREFVVGCLNLVLGATATDSEGIVVTDLMPLTQVQLAQNIDSGELSCSTHRFTWCTDKFTL